MTQTWSLSRMTCSKLWLMSSTAWPSSRSRRMSSSTLAVSWTPSAAVGSSMMTSLELKPAARQMATAWRWPPESRRTRDSDRGHVDGQASRPSPWPGAALRRGRGTRGARPADELAVEEEVLPDGEVLDEGEVLVNGLDPGLAGVLGGAEAPARRRRRRWCRLSGWWMPLTHRTSVDLPAPLSPTRAVTSPRRRVSETSLRARTLPKASETSVTSSRRSWAGLEVVIAGTS